MVNFYNVISKSRKIFLLLVLGCVGVISAQAQLGVNLIINGDAETAGGPVGNGWASGSTNLGFFAYADQGLWYLPDSSSYPNPQHDDNGTHQAHGGKYFFNAGVNTNPGADQADTLFQTINLASAGLTGQDLVFSFSGYVSTDGNLGPGFGDIVEIRIEYLDNGGLVKQVWDTMWVANISPPLDYNWHLLTSTQAISIADNVVTAKVSLIGTNDNSTNTLMAFYDDLSLVANLPLPIDLLNFTAAQRPDHTVGLAWQTAQEANSRYIEVQRSGDGKSFAPIGQVPAAGNSQQVRSYSFTDASPLSGNNFYRLKLVDLDGSFKYSKVLDIRPTVSGQTIEVFSNPFHDQIGMRITAAVPDRLVLSLMDATGRTCLRQSVNTQSGNNFINLYPSAGMASGVYFLHIQGSHTDQTIRVLKQ